MWWGQRQDPDGPASPPHREHPQPRKIVLPVVFNDGSRQRKLVFQVDSAGGSAPWDCAVGELFSSALPSCDCQSKGSEEATWALAGGPGGVDAASHPLLSPTCTSQSRKP